MFTRMELLLAVKRYIYMDVHLEFLQNLRDLLLNYGIKRVRSRSITINSGYPLKQVRFKLVDSYACFDFCPLMDCFVGQLMSNTCTLVGIFPLMPYIAKCRSSVDTLNTMSTCHDIWPILYVTPRMHGCVHALYPTLAKPRAGFEPLQGVGTYQTS